MCSGIPSFLENMGMLVTGRWANAARDELSYVYACKAGRVGDDSVGHKGSVPRISGKHKPLVQWLVPLVLRGRNAHAVAGLDTGPPAPKEYLLDLLTALLDITVLEGIQPWHKPRILDHERHQLGGISADVKELEPIFFNKGAEGGMSRQTDAVSVRVAENLT